MIELIKQIQISESQIGNAVVQAAVFEIAMILIVPLIGFLVNGVIVGGIRGVVQRFVGAKIEYILANYVLCVGTIIHELSHATFAILTGAEITEIALFKPEGDSLGHVSFNPRGPAGLQALQEGLSACAPVIMGVLICSLFYSKLFPILTAAWQWIIVIYVGISIIFHMNMSKADLKLYFKGIAYLALLALPFSIIYFIFFA